MPSYELSIILRALQKPELGAVVKRTVTGILDQGGLVRNMENLGTKPLPYKMSNHGERHYQGSYIVIRFDGPTKLPDVVKDQCNRDTDIIRNRIFPEDTWTPPCQTQPCAFGELPNPDHDRRLWWKRPARIFTKAERRKALLKK